MMPSESKHWSFFALLTGFWNVINGLTFSEWMGVLGFLGMVFSLWMSFKKFLNDRELHKLNVQIKMNTINSFQKNTKIIDTENEE